jgi:hypothetical protein
MLPAPRPLGRPGLADGGMELCVAKLKENKLAVFTL